MKLTVLGSGSCVVEQNSRASSGYILEAGSTTVMVDTGTGSTKNIPESVYSTADLDAVVNTHRHPDHVSDLLPVIQDKVVRSFSSEESDIVLYGPEGHEEYLKDRMRHEMVESPDSVEKNFGFSFEIKEIDSREKISQNLALEPIEALHGPESFECLSLKFISEGKEIVFTGDTDYNPELEEFAEGADILVADCSRPGSQEIEGHMNAEECGRLAEKARVGKLVLSHLYPETEGEHLKSQAGSFFGGEVVVAEDLMVIEY